MGKVRTRIIGATEVEEKQKKEQKLRAQEKKMSSKKDLPAGRQGFKAALKEEVALKPHDGAMLEKKVEKPVEKKKNVKKATVRLRGKKYQKAAKLTDKTKKYGTAESIELLKKMKYAAFDESVEIHLNLEKAGLRGEVELPNTIGKSTRAVIASQKVLDDIENGTIEFDVLIAEPSFMPRLAKYAKTLGPRGLMPSPKTGTISDKPQEVLKKYTGGFIKWRSEAEAPLLHQMVGKLSHDDKKILENLKVLVDAVGKANIKSAYIKSTMSPSLQIDLENL